VSKQDDASLVEVIEYVKAYAKQETVGPLKGAGRWLAFGAVGSFALGLGLMLVLLGMLRALQYELDPNSTGAWWWASYLLTIIVTALLFTITMLRIKKSTLNNEPK